MRGSFRCRATATASVPYRHRHPNVGPFLPHEVHHQPTRATDYTRMPDISILENQAFRLPANGSAGAM